MMYRSGYTMPTGTTTVTVGTGGAAVLSTGVKNNGGSSSIGTFFVAAGGDVVNPNRVVFVIQLGFFGWCQGSLEFIWRPRHPGMHKHIGWSR